MSEPREPQAQVTCYCDRVLKLEQSAGNVYSGISGMFVVRCDCGADWRLEERAVTSANIGGRRPPEYAYPKEWPFPRLKK